MYLDGWDVVKYDKTNERALRTPVTRKPDKPLRSTFVTGLGPQGIEVFFNLPGFGPFVNQAFKPILGAFFFDSSLQPFEAPTENCILAI